MSVLIQYPIANRCQTEILKAMGQPAQMDKLSEVQREVHLKLDGLDKRMDSMQMVGSCPNVLYQADL